MATTESRPENYRKCVESYKISYQTTNEWDSKCKWLERDCFRNMVFTWSAIHKKLLSLPSQTNQCCLTCKRLYYKILTSKGVFVIYSVQIWLFYYSLAQRRNVDVSHFGNSLLSRYCTFAISRYFRDDEQMYPCVALRLACAKSLCIYN